MYAEQNRVDSNSGKAFSGYYCYLHPKSGTKYNRINMTFTDVVLFLIPTGFMTFAYASIGKSLYKSIKENRQLSETGTGRYNLYNYTEN